MKLRFISSALAAALFAATGSYAAVVDGGTIHFEGELGNDSNLLIVFYVQIMPDDFVMQLHR
ncbi:type 1 fimbrial protein subunit FimA, partial [Escherichia coli]|nr:type 1 fimbrial protein subunit FimA [Escherichia coli]